MSTSLWFAKRTAFAVLSVYLVLSVMFLFVAFFPNLSTVLGADPPDGSPRDADTPLPERYVTWLVKFTTLDWTFGPTAPDQPGTTERIWESLKLTGTYLLPAMVLSYLSGLGVGLHAALRRDTRIDRAERLLAYVGFAIPAFFLALTVLYLLLYQFQLLGNSPYYDPDRSLWSTYNLLRLLPAALVLFVGMVSIQIRHVRSESARYVTEDFVKLGRAQGASTLMLARHVLRNAASGLVSLFVADLAGVVLLSTIAVEQMLNLQGFGALLWQAANARDADLVMGVTAVVVALAVGGSLLQDVLTRLIDPRIGSEGE